MLYMCKIPLYAYKTLPFIPCNCSAFGRRMLKSHYKFPMVMWFMVILPGCGAINALDGPHFVGDIFKCIIFNKILFFLFSFLKCVSKGPVDNKPSWVQISTISQSIIWSSLFCHICITQPPWVECLCCRELCVMLCNIYFCHKEEAHCK